MNKQSEIALVKSFLRDHLIEYINKLPAPEYNTLRHMHLRTLSVIEAMESSAEEINFNQEIGFNEFLDKTKRLPAGGVSCARMAWYSGIAWYKAKLVARAKRDEFFPKKMRPPSPARIDLGRYAGTYGGSIGAGGSGPAAPAYMNPASIIENRKDRA